MTLSRKFAALDKADRAAERLTVARRKLDIARQRGDAEAIKKAVAAVAAAERFHSSAKLSLAGVGR